MATPRSRHAARLRAGRRRRQARARRFAVLVVIGVLAAVTLALTAFDDSGGGSRAVTRPAPLPVTSAPPDPHVLATVGNLRLQSPVAEGGVTAVGFHGSVAGALTLHPVGPQANEGVLARLWRRITGSVRAGIRWYQLEGDPLRALDVGAVAGTDVYSPIDGTVVAIRDQIVSGRKIGSEIELRPTSAPSLVVTIQNVGRDPALTVGANVAAGSSRLGTVADVSRWEEQALAEYAPDGGNNVSVLVFPSATLGVP